MKYSFCILLFLGAASCNNSPTEHGKRPSINDRPIANDSRRYAKELISGKKTPVDNDSTLAWVDSLTNLDPNTRHLAFEVYAAIAPISDGALSEAFAEKINEAFIKFQGEVLDLYQSTNPDVRDRLIEDIYFEYSISNIDTSDIREAFEHYKTDCKDCDIDVLTEIKDSVITRFLRDAD